MGGDDFDRKHDLHLMGLSELGAVVKENEKGIYLEATHLVGKVIDFHTPTLTGSANIMIAAATADGTTIINNVDSRPEIDQLATLLSLLGAETISKNRIVRIRGLKKLHGGVTIKVMPDRLEAVTFMIAAGMTESSIVIRDFNLSCIPAEAHALRSTGIELWEREGDLFVSGMSQKRGFHIVTAPYPGLDSDTQPLFSALALTVPDVSLIDELRMSNRFKYMEQMKGFGGNIGIYGNTAIIQGGHPLIGTNVKALDIRGGAAYVLIGLAAMGFTRISNVYQIERGYDRFVEKLRAIGVSIKKHETLI
jgi:UDP-N-acetylglucosamine 1-carboxyvinyltransferase